MNIVSYLDNDSPNMPDVGEAPVYAVSQIKQPLNQALLVNQYPQVFQEGVGCLDGEYHIWLDTQQVPIQHPPRKVPVAVQSGSIRKRWHTGPRDRADTMGELIGSSSQERWSIVTLSGPQGPQ